MAPLLYSYGRALYELVLTQQGVMGKEEVAKNTNPVTDAKDESGKVGQGSGSASASAPANANFVFGGDGDDDDDDDDDDEEQGEADPNELEDDFNAAWDVLDVARTIYLRELEKPDLSEEEKKAIKLTLATCYLSLGDVSLETGE